MTHNELIREGCVNFKVVKRFKSGGVFWEHLSINMTQSDYKLVRNVGIEFARKGEQVKSTPKVHFMSEEYQRIYGKLSGTKYYRKCPDLLVGETFYEVEGYIPPFSKDKIKRMLRNGVSQSENIVINNTKGSSDRYIIKLIHDRVRLGQQINEVWLYEKGKIRMVYKKQ